MLELDWALLASIMRPRNHQLHKRFLKWYLLKYCHYKSDITNTVAWACICTVPPLLTASYTACPSGSYCFDLIRCVQNLAESCVTGVILPLMWSQACIYHSSGDLRPAIARSDLYGPMHYVIAFEPAHSIPTPLGSGAGSKTGFNNLWLVTINLRGDM